jgi:hypothetical protein
VRFPLAQMKARMSHRLLLFVWMAGLVLAGTLIVLGHKLHLIVDRWAMSPDEHREDEYPIGPMESTNLGGANSAKKAQRPASGEWHPSHLGASG